MIKSLIKENKCYSFLSVALLLYAVYVILGSLLRWFVHPGPPPTLTTWGFIHLLFWTLGPPIWFFFEYHLESDAEKRKKLKDSQDVTSKVWAAVLVVLVFSLTSQLKTSSAEFTHAPEPATGSVSSGKPIPVRLEDR